LDIVYYKEKGIFKKFSLVIISVILLTSIIPLQNVYAPSITFDSEINLSNNGSLSTIPEIVISGSNVYVVWIDGGNIFFKNSTDSGATFPGAALDIGNAATSDEGPPQIAVSGNNIYTTWKQGDNIKFINSTDNGVSFASAEVQLSSTSNTFVSEFPQVDTPGSNTVYTAWRDVNSGGSDEIVFKRSTDNGLNFDLPIIVGTTNLIAPNNAGTKIASDGTNVYVVWQNSTDILFARSTDSGQNFGAVQDIGVSSGLFLASLPEIVTAGSNVYVIWQQTGNIQFASNDNDGNSADWSGPITIGSSGGSNTGNTPKIAASVSGGTVYAVWRDDSTGGGDIIFKTSTDSGGTFGFPTTPSDGNLSGNTGTSTTPDIAVSGTNVHVVWDDSTPSGSNSDILHAFSTDDGVTFGSSQNISDDTETSALPKLAASGSSPFVVWEDGSPGEIFFRTGTLSAISVSIAPTQSKLSDTTTITVTDSGSSGSIIVNVKSDTTDPSTIPITLTEGPTGTFTGTITFTETGSSSGTTLQASPGDTITATFGSDSGTASIFPRTIDFNGITDFNLNSTANVRVIDQNSNLNTGSADTVTVTVVSTADPTGISLVLTETGVNTGVFGGTSTDPTKSTLIFAESPGLVSTSGSVFVNQTNTGGAGLDANAIDQVLVDFRSNTDLTGINLELTETGNSTEIFTGTLNLSLSTTDNSTGTLRVTGNDLIVATNPGGINSLLLVTPKASQNGALHVDIPSVSSIIATYKSASIAVSLTDALAPGGGGGGLVRPGLVVNVLAGSAGGGGGLPGPTVVLGYLALNDNAVERISMPQEIRDFIINDFDSHTPLEPITDVFEDYELPLSINGNGFALGGYENTLVPQTVKPGEPIEFTLVFYTTSEIAHTSLNFNLGLMRTIAGSDTQVLLYKDKFEIVDPNGNIATATGSINNEGDLKRVATFSITFSDDIQWSNSDFVIRSWNDNMNSGDIIVYDAIQVLPSEEEIAFEESLPEPEVEQLKSQYVPIWIKNNAAWWSEELIDDSDFVAGIEYLIQNEIITIQDDQVIASYSSNEIPEWIKNNAGWWSEDLITEKEFIDGLQWLISNGIIQVKET